MRRAPSGWPAASGRPGDDFAFVAPTGTLDDMPGRGPRLADGRPYFISDTGDNPTAGGAGDVTWGLTRLLARPEFREDATGRRVIVRLASRARPPSTTAVAAGVGATVTVTAGARGRRPARRAASP